jgi:putative membrane protein
VAFRPALTLLLAAPAAHAHAPDAPASAWGALLSQWTFEPWVVLTLALSAALYARGVARLWRSAGAARGVTRTQVACFSAGWLAVAAALVSPLDALGGRLFSAHMVQHEILMLVAAPLLVLGRPLAAWAWALPGGGARTAGRLFRGRAWSASWSLLTDPVAAWSLHALALWAWHVPRFFEGALASEWLHALQHTSFLATALLFWWAVLGDDARAGRRSGFALLFLFTTMLHTSVLGALLSLAPTPWYPAYAAHAAALGVDPVEDQQLGGLVMWVPCAFAYIAAGLIVLNRLLVRAAPRPFA